MDGILNLLKPPGMTSHDVINWVRRTFNEKKVGHTGTLDPGAAGVLPICIGKATKIIPYINEDIKIYRAKINFGITTDTQDKYGQVIKKSKPDFDIYDLNKVLKKFIGEIEQKPSIYSAIKVRGKKLYEYAREGIDVDIPIRKICIHDIRLIQYQLPDCAYIEVKCSKGTYIRTLCSDIGEFLGCGAHMGTLIRTRTGDFDILSSKTLEEVGERDRDPKDLLLSMDIPLNLYPRINIRGSAEKSLRNGNSIYPQGIIEEMNPQMEQTYVTAYMEDRFSAIGEVKWDMTNKRYYFKPLRVLL